MQSLKHHRSREKMTHQENVYKVEEIVGKRLRNGIEEYRIKWLNYSSSENTWEDEKNCYSCYELIVKYESTNFNSMQKFHPKITGVKVHLGKIKLLVEWRGLREKQYYYSKSIRLVDPTILIEFYEKYISRQDCDEKLERFHHGLREPEDVSDDDCEPDRIVATANTKSRKRMYLIVWKNKDEATIVADAWVKNKYPSLLVKFYEKHIFL